MTEKTGETEMTEETEVTEGTEETGKTNRAGTMPCGGDENEREKAGSAGNY